MLKLYGRNRSFWTLEEAVEYGVRFLGPGIPFVRIYMNRKTLKYHPSEFDHETRRGHDEIYFLVKVLVDGDEPMTAEEWDNLPRF